jgi:hypothetical protein
LAAVSAHVYSCCLQSQQEFFMIAIRHHRKVLFALPIVSLLVAGLIFVTAPKQASSPSAGFPPVGGLMSNLPSFIKPEQKDWAAMSYPEKLAYEKQIGWTGAKDPLWSGFRKRDPACRQPAIQVVSLSQWSGRVLERSVGGGKYNIPLRTIYQEEVWRARDAGLRVHAYFLTTDGGIPQKLKDWADLEVPDGVGMITQTPTGMVFPPDRATSAQYWLAAMHAIGEKPDPAGMLAFVIEPPTGGCK